MSSTPISRVPRLVPPPRPEVLLVELVADSVAVGVAAAGGLGVEVGAGDAEGAGDGVGDGVGVADGGDDDGVGCAIGVKGTGVPDGEPPGEVAVLGQGVPSSPG